MQPLEDHKMEQDAMAVEVVDRMIALVDGSVVDRRFVAVVVLAASLEVHTIVKAVHMFVLVVSMAVVVHN